MNSLIADEATLAFLRQADGMAEIRDTKGTVIGFFAPATNGQAARYLRAIALHDPEELRRRRAEEGPGLRTWEVLEHLLSLTDDEPTRAHLRATIKEVRERSE